MSRTTIDQYLLCKHCGAECRCEIISFHELPFCCTGCKTVYELLHHAELSAYYSQATPPGIRPQEVEPSRFAYLDDPEVRNQLIAFSDGQISRLTLSIPQIHCSSCIWLLENLYRLEPGINKTQVNFLRRDIAIQFDEAAISLRSVIELLARLGYEPHLKLDRLERPVQVRDPRKTLHLQVGIAGFCFGNIMLLSFPDYINSRELSQTIFPIVFRYLILALSLPVLLYSARDYFRSAILALRSRILTIDFPVALGLTALWVRSCYDIFGGVGPGYLDSFAGLVFFLLLGRVFQQRTYEQLSFERDFKAYFPASVNRKTANGQESIPITKLEAGDRIVVRNQELVPADAILIRGEGSIDYSFVTGESEPRVVTCGDRVFAGGRQVGTAIELDVIRNVSQSYLTSLWNNSAFQKPTRQRFLTLADTVGTYFIAGILFIAAATALYWLRYDVNTAVKAVTAVLIVACPCALALSSPFVLGTTMRIFGRHKLYLKNTAVVEALSAIDTIVFDKTGTLTSAQPRSIMFDGSPLTQDEQKYLKALVRHSTHPISRSIEGLFPQASSAQVHAYFEEAGNGIAGEVDNISVRLGRFRWANPTAPSSQNGFKGEGTVSYLAFNGVSRGKFVMTSAYRERLDETIGRLKARYSLSVVSGDNDRERPRLEAIFGREAPLAFNQSPHDKLAAVQSHSDAGKNALMIGDGLNDAGALKAAAVGIAVSENAIHFTPACDGIVEADNLSELDKFLALARTSRKLIVASFGLSILYNVVGLTFAVSGHLSPLVSAILMPISSVSVIAFATLSTTVAARRIGLK